MSSSEVWESARKKQEKADQERRDKFESYMGMVALGIYPTVEMAIEALRDELKTQTENHNVS